MKTTYAQKVDALNVVLGNSDTMPLEDALLILDNAENSAKEFDADMLILNAIDGD